MSNSEVDLPTELHHEKWPLGIQPQAFEQLGKQHSLLKVIGRACVLFLFSCFLVVFLRSIPFARAHPLESSMCLTVALMTLLLYCQIVRYQRLSWCVQHLEPTTGKMKIIHSPTNRIAILSDGAQEVECEPLSVTASDLYVKFGPGELEVRLWYHPITGLPVAAEHESTLVLLSAERPKNWDPKRRIQRPNPN